MSLPLGFLKNSSAPEHKNRWENDPFVVHEHDDWVFTLLRDMRLPPNLVMISAHYLFDVKKKVGGKACLCL